MVVPRRVRLGVALVVVAALGIGRLVETRRLAVALPRSGSGAVEGNRLDAERMLLDLRILASDRFEGRATGTPGGALAAQLIVARYGELGLLPFGDSFVQPFSFRHRSIRALWRRNRPFTQTSPTRRMSSVTAKARPRPMISSSCPHTSITWA